MTVDIKEDMDRQRVVIRCFDLIENHYKIFHERSPTDADLHHVLSNLVDRFERLSQREIND